MRLAVLLMMTLSYLSLSLGVKMKVISTDGGASFPRKEGRAEILNSSLVKYSQLTVCARFLTLHFSTDPDSWPTQSLISYGSDDLLGSYLAMSCDQSYTGCTQEHKDKFRENHLSWISGSVFGYLFVSNTPQFYPAWEIYPAFSLPKPPIYYGYFLFLAGSLWHKDSWILFQERSYYTMRIKNYLDRTRRGIKQRQVVCLCFTGI